MSDSAGYLLDGHVLLWWWFDPERLTQPVQALLVDPDTTVLLSAATVWELSLNHHQGNVPELQQAIGDLHGLVQVDGFQALPHPLVTAMAPSSSRFSSSAPAAAQASSSCTWYTATLLRASERTISGIICIGVESVSEWRRPAAISASCSGSMLVERCCDAASNTSTAGLCPEPSTNRTRLGVSL
jgi:PIN domain nuclease of toxin-antitoxin system